MPAQIGCSRLSRCYDLASAVGDFADLYVRIRYHGRLRRLDSPRRALVSRCGARVPPKRGFSAKSQYWTVDYGPEAFRLKRRGRVPPPERRLEGLWRPATSAP